MKIALKVTELLTRTLVVEADTYEEAEDRIVNSHTKGSLMFHADNSAVDLEIENDTDNYIEIFGKDSFEKMEPSREIL